MATIRRNMYQQRMNWKLHPFNPPEIWQIGINKEWIERIAIIPHMLFSSLMYQQRMNWKTIVVPIRQLSCTHVSTKNELKVLPMYSITPARAPIMYQQRMNWKQPEPIHKREASEHVSTKNELKVICLGGAKVYKIFLYQQRMNWKAHQQLSPHRQFSSLYQQRMNWKSQAEVPVIPGELVYQQRMNWKALARSTLTLLYESSINKEWIES